jgi:hypothetical protein
MAGHERRESRLGVAAERPHQGTHKADEDAVRSGISCDRIRAQLSSSRCLASDLGSGRIDLLHRSMAN